MKTIAKIREYVACHDDTGLALIRPLREAIARHDADPLAFAAREFLDTIAEHRHTLGSDHRRHLDRIAGNIRKLI